MATRADTLFLFDIDGTLLNTGGAGIAAINQAFASTFPAEAGRMPELDLAGATDSGIVMNLFEHADIEHTDGNCEAFYSAYLDFLCENLAAPDFDGRLLPGIGTLLDILASDHPTIATGLLTGNIERGARLKIDHFRVGHHFTFGSYGDDHHDRDRLGPIAIQRAEEITGTRFQRDRVFVIGDTAKDIRCARAAGAKAVAVSTGSVTRDQLESHSPDILFDDLSDTTTVLRTLGLDE